MDTAPDAMTNTQLIVQVDRTARQLTGQDRNPDLGGVARLRVIGLWAEALCEHLHGQHTAAAMLEEASLGQFARVAPHIAGGLAGRLEAEATPERDPARLAALDEVHAALRDTGATMSVHVLPSSPEDLRALAAAVRGDGPHPTPAPRSSSYAAVVESRPDPERLAALVTAIDIATEQRLRCWHRLTRRDNATAWVRARVLIDLVGAIAAETRDAGSRAAAHEHEHTVALALRARWHRDRLRLLTRP